ncbi:MAG TPA: alpha amylase C-terminal domain-containing protein, partial [Fermentimonas sp.]|nr:alpha amylase C-terminal domain-containing protein [Fermentimonas sp.]
QENAIYDGLFYDLMSANYDNPNFDSTRLFAFLRGSNDNVLLFIVNFDPSEKECDVIIPSHAYSFLNIEGESEGKLIPLLSDTEEEILFSDNQPIKVKVGAHSGCIYRLIFA